VRDEAQKRVRRDGCYTGHADALQHREDAGVTEKFCEWGRAGRGEERDGGKGASLRMRPRIFHAMPSYTCVRREELRRGTNFGNMPRKTRTDPGTSEKESDRKM